MEPQIRRRRLARLDKSPSQNPQTSPSKPVTTPEEGAGAASGPSVSVPAEGKGEEKVAESDQQNVGRESAAQEIRGEPDFCTLPHLNCFLNCF